MSQGRRGVALSSSILTPDGGTYGAILTIHSWLRWGALLFGIAATINAFTNRSVATVPLPGRWWDVLFMAAVDVQVLFGLLLYFGLSPFTAEGLNDFRGALRNPPLRYWTVDHIGLMVAAVILVRTGRVLAMSARTAAVQRLRRGLCFGLAVGSMLAGTPWPGSRDGRPLFRKWNGTPSMVQLFRRPDRPVVSGVKWLTMTPSVTRSASST
jgi:hypothetical protein